MAVADLSTIVNPLSPLLFIIHTGFTLNNTADWLAFGFVADRTASADQVTVRTGSMAMVAGTDTFRIGIETATLSGSLVTPDGTYLGGGSAYGDLTDAASNTHYTITLGATASLTKGQDYFVTVRWNAGTFGTAVFQTHLNTPTNRPILAYDTAAALTNSTNICVAGIRYGSASAWNLGNAAIVGGNNTWNSGSSPRFRGNKFTAPCDFWSSRILTGFRPAAAGDFSIEVYKNASTSAEFTIAVDADDWIPASNMPGQFHHDDYMYEEGETYRVVVNPTTGTTNTSWYDFTAGSAGELAAVYGAYCKTTAVTVSGGWTDTTTAAMGIVVVPNGVELPASSGGIIGVAHA